MIFSVQYTLASSRVLIQIFRQCVDVPRPVVLDELHPREGENGGSIFALSSTFRESSFRLDAYYRGSDRSWRGEIE